MATYNRPITLGDLVKSEPNTHLSREQVILVSGKQFKLGAVLGRKRGSGTTAVAAGVADAGMAGNGTLVLAGTPYTDTAREGPYRITFVSATKANVSNPLGAIIGVATVGQAFSKDVAFTLTAGGTPWAAGDAYTLSVSFPSNDGVCDEWDPVAGTGGVEEVYGLLLWDVDTTGGASRSVALVRGAAMVADDLVVWKSGLTTAQKSDGFQALSNLGIAIRETI